MLLRYCLFDCKYIPNNIQSSYLRVMEGCDNLDIF